MKLKGHVHKYGADVNTDVIIPARYLNLVEPAELAQHCMADIDAEFIQRVQSGDMIVAATNFGCGSSREHAPLAIKAAGVSCVIAASFARIFYRNAINIALPIVECPEATQEAETGDLMKVELATGEVKNLSKGKAYKANPYPNFMMELMSAGGLIEYTRKKLARRKAG